MKTQGDSAVQEKDQEVTYTPTRDLTFERLLDEVKTELTDPRYLNLTHGGAATYNKGCRGHLCTYRVRTKRREARRAKMADVKVIDTRPRQEQLFDHACAKIIEKMGEVEMGEIRAMLRKAHNWAADK